MRLSDTTPFGLLGNSGDESTYEKPGVPDAERDDVLQPHEELYLHKDGPQDNIVH